MRRAGDAGHAQQTQRMTGRIAVGIMAVIRGLPALLAKFPGEGEPPANIPDPLSYRNIPI